MNNLQKLFIKTVLTFSAIEFAASISSIIDGLIVERYLDETALQAIGLMWPYILLVKLICSIIMAGTVILCSDEIGKGNAGGASLLFSSSFTAIVLVCIPVMVLLQLFAFPLASVLGAVGPELMESTAAYLRGMSAGMLVHILTLFLLPFMQIDNDRKRIPISTGIFILVNTAFNIITASVLGMGIFGIGLSTSIGYACSFCYLLMHFRRPDCNLKLKFRIIDRSTLRAILGLGKVNGINRAVSMARNTLVNRSVILFGGLSALTAHSVFSIFKLSMIAIPMGIGSAGMLIISLLYAEHSKKEIHELWRFALCFTLIVVSAVAVLIFFLSEPLLTLYFSDGSPDEAILLFKIHAIGMPLLALRQLYMYHHVAAKNTGIALMANILGEFVITTICFYVLGALFGTVGLWAAYPVSELVFWIVIVLFCAVKKKKEESFADRLLALDALSAGICRESSLRICCLSTEFDTLTRRIQTFCTAEGLSKSCYNRISNLIESSLTITFKDTRPGSVRCDIRLILLEDNTLVIRLRSNGRAQQLLTGEQLKRKEDKREVPELSILYGYAEDVSCITSMNLNNLIIRLRAETLSERPTILKESAGTGPGR